MAEHSDQENLVTPSVPVQEPSPSSETTEPEWHEVSLWQFLTDLKIMAWLGAFATLLGYLSSLSFLADIVCQFRVQMAVVLTFIALGMAAVCLRKKPIRKPDVHALIVAAVAVVLNVVPVVWTTMPIPGVNTYESNTVAAGIEADNAGTSKASRAGRRLKIVDYNLRFDNKRCDEFKKYIAEHNPDIICMQEYSLQWKAGLAEIKKDYPYEISQTREDPFGIAIYSRLPMTNQSIVVLSEMGLPSAFCRFQLDGKVINFLDTHPYPPLNNYGFGLRDHQYHNIVDLVRKTKGDYFLVCGDFNCAPWSSNFQWLLSALKMKDSRIGFGLGQSWPADIWILRIPLDHVLTTKNISTLKREVGADIGSDHLPVYLELLAH